MVDQPTEASDARWRSATQAAVDVLNTSMDYYTRLARQAKVFYFTSETLLLVAGASIPVTAAFTSSRAVPAVLGGWTSTRRMTATPNWSARFERSRPPRLKDGSRPAHRLKSGLPRRLVTPSREVVTLCCSPVPLRVARAGDLPGRAKSHRRPPPVRFAARLLGRMDAREERLARNETLFRSVNENIEEAATSRQIDEHTFEFFCECSNVDCTLLLPLTVAEYEQVRADPRQFVVAPGHELPEIENVVTQTSAYQVVLKEGEAAEFVTEHDPRSG